MMVLLYPIIISVQNKTAIIFTPLFSPFWPSEHMWWLGAWLHQVIVLVYVDFSSARPPGTHSNEIWIQMFSLKFEKVICTICAIFSETMIRYSVNIGISLSLIIIQLDCQIDSETKLPEKLDVTVTSHDRHGVSIRSSDNDSTGFWPPGSLHTLGADGHI